MSDDLLADLRIIAHDALKLKDWERAAIRQAADELETAYKALAVSHLNTQEALARCKALADQVMEKHRKSGAPIASMSGSFVVLPGPT